MECIKQKSLVLPGETIYFYLNKSDKYFEEFCKYFGFDMFFRNSHQSNGYLMFQTVKFMDSMDSLLFRQKLNKFHATIFHMLDLAYES